MDSPEKRYTQHTIHRYGKYFQKGGERLQFSDLEPHFTASAVGLEILAMATRYRTTSRVLKVLSVVAGVVTVSLVASKGNLDPFYYGVGAQIGLGIAGQIYQNMAHQQTDKAIWQRNRDVLFSGQ
jgi:hypothetical protein